MAVDISQETQAIRTAVFAKDVRDSIANGLDTMASEMNTYEEDLSSQQDSVTERQTNLENQYNQQISNNISSHPSSAETVAARTSGVTGTAYTNIGLRMDNTDSQLAEIVTLNVKNLPSPLVSLKGDGVTDDSVAFQAALDYLVSIGGGKLFFPSGVYMLNGALQDTSNYNSVIKIPSVGAGNKPILISIEGACPPPTAYPEELNMEVSNYGTIFYSKTTGSGNYPSVLGGNQNGQWSNLTLAIKNLLFRQPNNPSLWNLQTKYVGNVILENVTCDVDASITKGITLPTNNTLGAMYLPTLNNYGLVKARNIYIVGYFNGIRHNEHANLDNIFIQCCCTAFVLENGYHACYWGKILVQQCQTVICYAGDSTKSITLYCDVLDIEDAPSTEQWTVAQHILDGGNCIHGYIKMLHRVLGYFDILTQDIIKAGGNNLFYDRVLNNITDFYIDAVNGNDTTGYGTSTSPYKSINRIISILPKSLKNTITIHIADGTYNEDIILKDFNGEDLLFEGDTANTQNVIINTCQVINCSNHIEINGIKSIKTVLINGYNCHFVIKQSNITNIFNIYVSDTGASNIGIYSVDSKTFLDNCNLSNLATAFLNENSISRTRNLVGAGNTNGIKLISGFVTMLDSTTTTATNPTVKTYGGQIFS